MKIRVLQFGVKANKLCGYTVTLVLWVTDSLSTPLHIAPVQIGAFVPFGSKAGLELTKHTHALPSGHQTIAGFTSAQRFYMQAVGHGRATHSVLKKYPHVCVNTANFVIGRIPSKYRTSVTYRNAFNPSGSLAERTVCPDL